MQLVTAIVAVVGTFLTVLLLAATARRVMGAPVGWIRSALVSFVVLTAGSWGITAVLEAVGYTEGTELLVGWAPIALVAALAWAWAFVLGLSLLLVLELLVPTGSVPTPWHVVRRLRQTRLETRRYAQILTILVRHGFGGALRRGARRADGTRVSRRDQHRVARELRGALTEAGVTFVKFGQVLSTRRDLLPAAFVDELATLQSDVPPAPWSQIEPVVRAALGRPVEEVFAVFEPEPIASASVGQVHAARTVDGRDVVVKVQRPGARAQVEVDLAILTRLARRVERDTDWGRSFGAVELAAGFAESLREELDYTVELQNTENIPAALETAVDERTGAPLVRVPQTYPELSGPVLLVMERLDGVPVGHAGAMLAGFAGPTRTELAERLLRATLEQLLVAGAFHADLHPGNVLVTRTGDLGLLDFGSVGRLGEPERVALGALLLAIEGDDAIAATDALLEILDRPEGLDERRLERRVGRLIVQYRRGPGTGGGGAMLAALLRLVADAGLSVPSQVAAAFRTISALEGTLRLLDPHVDLVSAAQEQGEPILRRLVTFGTVRRKAAQQLLSFAPTLERLPRQLTRIATDLEQGRTTVRVRALADPSDRAFLTNLVQQVISTVIASAAVIGAVILLAADTGPMITEGLRLFAMIGGFLAFIGTVLAIRVLVFAFRGPAGHPPGVGADG